MMDIGAGGSSVVLTLQSCSLKKDHSENEDKSEAQGGDSGDGEGELNGECVIGTCEDGRHGRDVEINNETTEISK
jgi:hypothetical protein